MSKKKKLGFFTKLKLAFREKQILFEEIVSLNDQLALQIDRTIKTVESFEQHKVYFVHMNSASQVLAYKEVFHKLSLKLNWTPPKILYSTQKFEHLTKEKLEYALDKYFKKRRKPNV